MTIDRVEWDLAKNVFSVCRIDAHQHIAPERTLKRAELLLRERTDQARPSTRVRKLIRPGFAH